MEGDCASRRHKDSQSVISTTRRVLLSHRVTAVQVSSRIYSGASHIIVKFRQASGIDVKHVPEHCDTGCQHGQGDQYGSRQRGSG